MWWTPGRRPSGGCGPAGPGVAPGGARAPPPPPTPASAGDGDTVKLGKVRFVNANDGTCEGIDYPEQRAFTVQFHPEACTGPKDTGVLFDQFVELMKGGDR